MLFINKSFITLSLCTNDAFVEHWHNVSMTARFFVHIFGIPEGFWIVRGVFKEFQVRSRSVPQGFGGFGGSQGYVKAFQVISRAIQEFVKGFRRVSGVFHGVKGTPGFPGVCQGLPKGSQGISGCFRSVPMVFQTNTETLQVFSKSFKGVPEGLGGLSRSQGCVRAFDAVSRAIQGFSEHFRGVLRG